MSDSDEKRDIEMSLKGSSEVKNAIKDIRGKAPGSSESEDTEQNISRRRVIQGIGVASAGIFAGATGLYRNPAILSDRGPVAETNDSRITGAAVSSPYISQSSTRSNSDFQPDVYVDPVNGNDQLYGQKTQPVETLREGIKKAKPGEKILVKQGSNSIERPIIVDKKVEIKIEEGSKFVINAENYIKRALDNLEAAIIVSSDNVKIDGSPGRIEIKNTPGNGMALVSSQDFEIRGITLNNNRKSGLKTSGSSYGTIEYCSSKNNSSADDECHGFEIASGSEKNPVSLIGCISHNNVGDGFSAQAFNGIVFDRCVAYWNKKSGSFSSKGFRFANSNSQGYYMTHCIAYGNYGAGIYWKGGPHTVEHFTGWNNSKGVIGSPDVEFARGAKGKLTKSLVTGVSESYTAGVGDTRIAPIESWGINTETDRNGAPANPSVFLKPDQ